VRGFSLQAYSYDLSLMSMPITDKDSWLMAQSILGSVTYPYHFHYCSCYLPTRT
jgi:hypothetical protein